MKFYCIQNEHNFSKKAHCLHGNCQRCYMQNFIASKMNIISVKKYIVYMVAVNDVTCSQNVIICGHKVLGHKILNSHNSVLQIRMGNRDNYPNFSMKTYIVTHH